ncbi:MAG: AbiH family protein, partial [Thomasclavelia spiroformis]
MVIKMKNVLVIGNGFDIAHGLYTKYIDFYNFCN